MNVILNFYYFIPNLQRWTIVGKAVNNSIGIIVKRFFDLLLPWYFKKTVNNPKHKLTFSGDKPITVASLTSFPDRIHTVHLSIECILRQAVKPDKIILWLAQQQFPNLHKDLPKNLLALQNRGLEIKFCDDLRSHKKYYYSLLEYPNSKIIMFDDDLYYHKDVIKNLLVLNRKYPNCIIATRAHKMVFDNQKRLLPYSKWLHNYNVEKPSLFVMHTSGHGTLIPGKYIFDETVFNKDLILKLCPKSDDVWLKMNLIRLNVSVVTNGRFNKDSISVKESFASSLVSENSFKGMKDMQIRNCINHFNFEF